MHTSRVTRKPIHTLNEFPSCCTVVQKVSSRDVVYPCALKYLKTALHKTLNISSTTYAIAVQYKQAFNMQHTHTHILLSNEGTAQTSESNISHRICAMSLKPVFVP